MQSSWRQGHNIEPLSGSIIKHHSQFIPSSEDQGSELKIQRRKKKRPRNCRHERKSACPRMESGSNQLQFVVSSLMPSLRILRIAYDQCLSENYRYSYQSSRRYYSYRSQARSRFKCMRLIFFALGLLSLVSSEDQAYMTRKENLADLSNSRKEHPTRKPIEGSYPVLNDVEREFNNVYRTTLKNKNHKANNVNIINHHSRRKTKGNNGEKTKYNISIENNRSGDNYGKNKSKNKSKNEINNMSNINMEQIKNKNVNKHINKMSKKVTDANLNSKKSEKSDNSKKSKVKNNDNKKSKAPSSYPQYKPSRNPQVKPTRRPQEDITIVPTRKPSKLLSKRPSANPSIEPSNTPSALPSNTPSTRPSVLPSTHPSTKPSEGPSLVPSDLPSNVPSLLPSSAPSHIPSLEPSSGPTQSGSVRPSQTRTNIPTFQPSGYPSDSPSIKPSANPSSLPTYHPSRTPSKRPTADPSKVPSSMPTHIPLDQITTRPSLAPTSSPSQTPSTQPTAPPSANPSSAPSNDPTSVRSKYPSVEPSRNPSVNPSIRPSGIPTDEPSTIPSEDPSGAPSSIPSYLPTEIPSVDPSATPTIIPSAKLSTYPSTNPSIEPSAHPSISPSVNPSQTPTRIFSTDPSLLPSYEPTKRPSANPSIEPSHTPSALPSNTPRTMPSVLPSTHPSTKPSEGPSLVPSDLPSNEPSLLTSSSLLPTVFPDPNNSPNSYQISSFPTNRPIIFTSNDPSVFLSTSPSSSAFNVPTDLPSPYTPNHVTQTPSVGHLTQLPSYTTPYYISRIPSSEPIVIPSNYPYSDPTMIPFLSPSRLPSIKESQSPIFSPTPVLLFTPTSLPTFVTINPTSSPTTLISTFNGTVSVQLSILTDTFNTSKILPGSSGISRVSNLLERKNITALDIISGNEPELLNDVLTSIMGLFCNITSSTKYAIVVPSSTFDSDLGDSAGNKFANFCTKDTFTSLSSLPGGSYSESDTVLFLNITDSQGCIEVSDRSMFLTIGQNAIEEINWIVWGISFNIWEVGPLAKQNIGRDINEALSQVNMIANKDFIAVWTTGLVDQVLKLKNNNIIATSLVGAEMDTFSKALLEVRTNWNDANNSSSTYTGDITDRSGNRPDDDDRDRYNFFSAIRILGFCMFLFVITIVIRIQHSAQEKKMDNILDLLSAEPIADLQIFDDWSITDVSFETEVQSNEDSVMTGVSWT